MSGATTSGDRAITLLIAALGGEGGGVLADWIVNAARASDHPVQATSIPGVAQRTGATTYYIEMWPRPWAELGDKTPIMALNPAIGEIDLLVASEFLECGRAIQAGFVTPDRTLLMTSNSRVYSTVEKMAMADGRFDTGKLMQAAETRAREAIVFDMDQAAKDAGALISSVMLGAIAGSGVLPIDPEAYRAGIRAEGKAVETNLRGFQAGIDAVSGSGRPQQVAGRKRPDPNVDAGPLLTRAQRDLPAAVHEVACHAVRRLVDYQDTRYAGLYLDRLAPFAAGDGDLLQAVARHLAVRMSFEDIIRVAQAKIRPERLARIRAETGAAPGEPVTITEFFKPGIAEIADILPEWMARRLLRRAEKSPRVARFHMSMTLNSTSVSGQLKLRFLARLRRFRRRTWRFRREQEAIVDWLGLVERAAAIDTALALEVADLARLIKGYGDTHVRGSTNYRLIVDRFVGPALAGEIAPGPAAEAIAGARTTALADPEGAALQNLLAQAAPEAAPLPVDQAAE